MLELVLEALRGAGVERTVMVVGHGRDQIQAYFEGQDCKFALQEEQHGTGHATMMAAPDLADFDGPVIVTPGDTPLITADAIRRLLVEHVQTDASVTVATFYAADPMGYGRLVRDGAGHPVRIVEHKDASEAERQISEVNSAVYCFNAKELFAFLPKIGNQNAQKEYYLTDVLRLMALSGRTTHAVVFDEVSLFQGVNDRWQLAQAGEVLRHRIAREHCLAGVTIVDPATTYIGPFVKIAPDVTIEPMVMLGGRTRIGSGSIVQAGSRIMNSTLGEGCVIKSSHILDSELGDNVIVGPFAHLRPGSKLGNGTKIGNFVETKNAVLGANVSAGHLTYLGDAEIGDGSNIGAGTITCNYDGYRKHQTTVGEGAFVGSNSTLVAPVTVADGAYVAAGSTITNDVTADALALGRARQVEKEQWAQRWREKNQPETGS